MLTRFSGTDSSKPATLNSHLAGLASEEMDHSMPIAGMPADVSARGNYLLLFDPLDTAAITHALTRLTNHDTAAALTAAGQERVGAWGPGRFGNGMAQAAHVAAAEAARPSVLDRATLDLVARRR